jgi:hypothetical protein
MVIGAKSPICWENQLVAGKTSKLLAKPATCWQNRNCCQQLVGSVAGSGSGCWLKDFETCW